MQKNKKFNLVNTLLNEIYPKKDYRPISNHWVHWFFSKKVPASGPVLSTCHRMEQFCVYVSQTQIEKKNNDYPSILHIESLIGNHKYLQFATDQHRCDLWSPLLHTMAYCSHSHVLLSSNNNTQCEMKLVRLRMKGLTPTYDVVAGAVSPLSPSRVGRYKITKWVVYE